MRTTLGYRSSGISFGGIVPPGIKWLLTANIAIFAAEFFIGILTGRDPFLEYFALYPGMVLRVYGVYQLVTYMFLHSTRSILHIVFNMLILWMFGANLERTWGTRRFLQYYFLCGIGAGVCVVIGNVIAGTPGIPTIGASGAIYGVLLAFGVLFPDAIVLFSFLFPIKAKYFVMIIGAIAFFNSLAAPGSGVSHVAHLGGMLFGYLYLRTGLVRIDLIGPLRQGYEDWKFRRAKKKFQVYLRKKESDRDRWVH